MNDKPQIDFFAFKARKFCAWVDKTSGSAPYDGIRAVHVVSGVIASATKLLRMRIAGRPEPPRPAPGRTATATADGSGLPVDCRADWAAICRHRERTGGLPGCLVEIRRELERGLAILDEGRPYEAVSHWQLGYVHNWGELAICALMMLHSDVANATSS